MARKEYEKGRIAVDAVIFTIYEQTLHVVLHKRNKDPYKNQLELPGGLLFPNETADETLRRKLKEITGHHNIFSQQFFTFTEPTRDPRGRTVSIGYIALINKEKIGDLGNWHSIRNLPRLAFDHKKIIDKARSYLKENTSSLIVKQFMPEHFPLNQLQEAYEVIEDRTYDNRNFRKKMITSAIVKETKMMEKDVSHRPAKLFKIN